MNHLQLRKQYQKNKVSGNISLMTKQPKSPRVRKFFENFNFFISSALYTQFSLKQLCPAAAWEASICCTNKNIKIIMGFMAWYLLLKKSFIMLLSICNGAISGVVILDNFDCIILVSTLYTFNFRRNFFSTIVTMKCALLS